MCREKVLQRQKHSLPGFLTNSWNEALSPTFLCAMRSSQRHRIATTGRASSSSWMPLAVRTLSSASVSREVLDGVGADRVGVKSHFSSKLQFLPRTCPRRMREKRRIKRKKGKTKKNQENIGNKKNKQQNNAKMGEFLGPPSTPTPLRTSQVRHNKQFGGVGPQPNIVTYVFLGQVPGCTGSIRAPSCELWRSLANFGELWRTHNSVFTSASLTFTRVPAKVPHIHQSSGEGAFCICPEGPKIKKIRDFDRD